ncbi:MAG: hypothetical protein M0R73_03165 [Dehalococcoidia bacterium]|nr:hypothetical protein [Dehalococcoidia bacterium]
MTTMVVCPQCNRSAEIEPGEHPFCRHCDYPLFWVMPRPRTTGVAPDKTEEAPRRPGVMCVVCRTTNPSGRSLCRTCGQPLMPVTPRRRRSWEAPVVEEERASRWKRVVIWAVAIVVMVALLAAIAWAVWTFLWPRSEWQTVVLDQGESSWDIAATLERGSPVISYVDAGDHTLRVVICGNPLCDVEKDANLYTTIAVLGPSAEGQGTAVGIGADGRPLIAYRFGPRRALTVAHCGDTTCADPGAITITELDPGPTVLDPGTDTGVNPSMTIGRDGLAIIAYHDRARGALKIAHCDNAACTSATIAVLDRSPNAVAGTEGVGSDTSIQIGPDGLPVIAFRDGDQDALMLARCSDHRCTQAVISTIVREPGRSPGHDASMVLAPDGSPIVAYSDWSDDGVYVAKCATVTCEDVSLRRLDRPEDGTSGDTALGLDEDGLPVVAYRQRQPGDERASRVLKVVRCGDLACMDASIPEDVDARGRTGYTPNFLLLQDGTLALAYGDATEGALEYAVYR